MCVQLSGEGPSCFEKKRVWVTCGPRYPLKKKQNWFFFFLVTPHPKKKLPFLLLLHLHQHNRVEETAGYALRQGRFKYHKTWTQQHIKLFVSAFECQKIRRGAGAAERKVIFLFFNPPLESCCHTLLYLYKDRTKFSTPKHRFCVFIFLPPCQNVDEEEVEPVRIGKDVQYIRHFSGEDGFSSCFGHG